METQRNETQGRIQDFGKLKLTLDLVTVGCTGSDQKVTALGIAVNNAGATDDTNLIAQLSRACGVLDKEARLASQNPTGNQYAPAAAYQH